MNSLNIGELYCFHLNITWRNHGCGFYLDTKCMNMEIFHYFSFDNSPDFHSRADTETGKQEIFSSFVHKKESNVENRSFFQSCAIDSTYPMGKVYFYSNEKGQFPGVLNICSSLYIYENDIIPINMHH